MAIEQVYCTHCTYGTSALEQREGELADRVLGYSARAGSAERNELRNDYRAIERFLYYYLPSDTPPEEKQRLDAAGAPRRLFFCPSMGRLQMAGQVAYRQYDTAGRLGSYFAHVLFADRAGGDWSTVDCLRLWNAPWTQEDSPDHPFKLPVLERLDAVWAGARPAIGDDALLQFLQASAPAGEEPGQLIGPRWQNMPAQQRIDLIANTLQGLLALGTQRRESVLLVVEPGIAALVFYGVARLLPKSLADGLSFSTYEPNAERLPVTLAATTFFDPQTTDIRSDLYRRRGLVINTYQDRVSEGGVPPGDYARFMIEQLLEEGWPAVDRLREAFETAGAKRPEDLELLVPTHRLVSQVLSASAPQDDSWRKSELAARYLAREVQYQLATPPGNGFRLNRVVGTPNHLTVLELITCEPPVPGLQRPAQLLLKEFPPDRISELVASPLLARGAKLDALASYASSQGRLPAGCRLLEEQAGSLRTRSPSGDWLLPDLLARLPEGVLRRVYEAIEEGQLAALLPALVAACKPQASPSAAAKRLLLEVLSRLDDEAFFAALVQHGRELGETYPPPEPALAERLGRALYELPDQAKDFERRLTVLDHWKSYFSYPNLAERRLGEWKKVRSCLLELGEREEKLASGRLERLKHRLRPPRPPDFKPLGEALFRAMPKRTSQLAELAEVAENCRLDVAQFKSRLELAARQFNCPMTFERDAADAQTIKNAPGGGPQAELEQLHRRREQQARMSQLLRELEERLWIYGDDASGKRKLQVLQRIAQTLLGRSPLTLEGKQEIELYFETGSWPNAGALLTGKGKRRFKLKYPSGRPKQANWISIAGVGLVVALLVPLLGHFVLSGRSPGVPSKQIASRPPETNQKNVKASRSTHDETSTAVDVENEPVDEESGPEMEEGPPEQPTAEAASGPVKGEHASVDAKGDPTPNGAASKSGGSKSAESKGAVSSGAVSSGAVSSGAATKGPDQVPSTDKPPGREDPSSSAPATAPAKDDAGQPTDGQPPVKESTGEPVLRTVDEYRVLPKRSDSSLQALHLSGEKWPAQPDRIKLALHGLQSANEWLKSRADGQLVASLQGQTLRVAVQSGTDDGQALAHFDVGEKDVNFRWFTHEAGPPASSYYEALQRCVLEVIGDSPSTLVALTKPVTTGDRGMQSGGATLDLQGFHNGEFRFELCDEITLGHGQIELQNGRRLAFGEIGQVAQTAAIEDLPDEYAGSGAQFRLTRRGANSLIYDLRLESAPDKLPDGLQPLSDNEAKILAALRERLPKLESAAGKLGSRPTEKLLSTIDQHVKSLSEVLSLPDPPKYDKSVRDAAQAYEAELRAKIIIPAAARKEALQKRRTAEMARQSEFKQLKSEALKFSAVLYRRVDQQTYASCLIFGQDERADSTGVTGGVDNSDVAP